MLNDARAYDVGLSDDAGGGNPLCLASKVRHAPRLCGTSRAGVVSLYETSWDSNRGVAWN